MNGKPILALMAVLLSGCDMLGIGRVCTDISAFALSVEAIDSLTGAAPQTTEITAVARDGSYADTALVRVRADQPLQTLMLARERPGWYRVDVTAPNYLRWTRVGVRARKDGDGCHVETVRLVARLQRQQQSL